ncbi:MAG: hypothetical protein ABMB14_36490 [Myxococcota bacterium]
MASRVAVGLIAAGGLLTAAAGFAAVNNEPSESHAGRGVFDPRAEALEDLSARLQAQERSLERREKSVVDREAELRAIEARLSDRTAELDKLRAEIDALRTQVDAEHAARVASVVKTVEAMKPAAAAGMVGKLDQDLAIEVVKSMSSSKAGKLLAALPPATAAKITEGVAGPGGPVGAPGRGAP